MTDITPAESTAGTASDPRPRPDLLTRLRLIFMPRGKPGRDPIDTYPELYLIAMILFLLAYGLVGAVVGGGTPVEVFGYSYSLRTWIWYVGIVHLLTGFRVVDRSNLAGVLILGIPTIEISGFFVFTPWLLCMFVQYPLAPTVVLAPTDPSKVWRGEDPTQRPPGFEDPIRIPFAGRTHSQIKDEVAKEIISEGDPLLMRATEEVTFEVRFSIKRGTRHDDWGFFDFYVRIGLLEKAKSQVRSIGIARVNEELTKLSVAEALATLEKFNTALAEHLNTTFEEWGVDIVTAKVTINLSHSMNKAIEGIPESVAKKQSAINDAQAEEATLYHRGQGEASAIEAKLDARGKGIRRMKKDTGIDDAQILLGADVAQSIAQGPGSKFFFPHLGELAGSIGRALRGPTS